MIFYLYVSHLIIFILILVYYLIFTWLKIVFILHLIISTWLKSVFILYVSKFLDKNNIQITNISDINSIFIKPTI